MEWRYDNKTPNSSRFDGDDDYNSTTVRQVDTVQDFLIKPCMHLKGFFSMASHLSGEDSAHFWIWSSKLADQNSKICRICISQSDAIERKPFTQDKLRVYCPNIYVVFSFQLGGAAANRVSQWLWNFHAKDSKFGLSFVFKKSNACRLYVNEVNLIYENNCHCHFVNNTC